MIKIVPVIDVDYSYLNPKPIEPEVYVLIEKALSLGADGVILSNFQTAHAKELAALAEDVKRKYAPIWLGIQCLDSDTKNFPEYISPELDAVWCGVSVGFHTKTHPHAEATNRMFRTFFPNTLHFAEVSYLETREATIKNLKKAATISAPYMDIISYRVWGKEKDIQSELEELNILSQVLPLAVNGGIKAENITNYLPYVEWCLPQLGYHTRYSQLGPKEFKAFVETVRQWEQNNTQS